MTEKLFAASGNINKIKEISDILKQIPGLKLYTPFSFGISINVTENGTTLEQNAFQKAVMNYDVINIPVLSDDSGLFVDALNGDPGIYSARYAGINAAYSDNCKKLLYELRNTPLMERTARFESVICLYINEKEHYFFKGICNGIIINECRGENGFGYDPLFVPDGYELTFAELSDSIKNKISHRALALKKLREFNDSYFH